MRRWVAILLLCLVGAFLGATGMDKCVGSADDTCAPVCHLLCSDGCAVAPVPEAPVPPAPDPLPRLHYEAERAEHLVSLVIEPEKDPPRV